MISTFPLWTFHLYVAAFQQHLHMEYMSLSWSDIPELDSESMQTRKLLQKLPGEIHHFESFTVATMTYLALLKCVLPIDKIVSEKILFLCFEFPLDVMLFDKSIENELFVGGRLCTMLSNKDFNLPSSFRGESGNGTYSCYYVV